MNVTIGGDAGQGVESSGAGFAKALARAGFEVFTLSDYRSRIRGGHNFFQIRVTDRPVDSHGDGLHLLLAFTKETLELHAGRMLPGGGMIYDEGFRIDEEAYQRMGLRCFPAPLTRIAEAHGNKVMVNTAAVAVAAGILGLDLAPFRGVVEENFRRKSERIAEANRKVLEEAYAFARDRFTGFRHTLPPNLPGRRTRMLLHGNHAFCLGAAAAGCRFIAAYPMTPATTIFEWMVANARRLGIVTRHAEDEIAAVCMAIGAAFSGARAMTATSGGGFSLMTEALGLAGMTEVPLVIAEVQRGGPSTGLPTRTEQSDLLFVINASHGEFPRIVIAPGSIEACFRAGWRAFNLAEKYQCPVIVISDLYLASSMRTLEPDALSLNSVEIDRGKLIEPAASNGAASIHSFEYAEDGVSPRFLPGCPGLIRRATSDEHDEAGHITEDVDVRRKMMAKRMNKLQAALADMAGPTLTGPEEADVTLLCWGSSCGPAREALRLLQAEGAQANLLHFEDLWPFPAEAARRALAKARRTITIEQNYTAQFARLLRMTTGHEVDGAVLKYDGRQLSPAEIAAGVRKEVAIHV